MILFFVLKNNLHLPHLLLSKMFRFSYFGSNSLSENEDYIAFWKCNEKIKVSPFSFLQELQLFSKLHVVYLQILQ